MQPRDNVPTVQGSIEEALCTLLQVPREKLGVMAAGRTDRGVHAKGQVHVKEPDWPRCLIYALFKRTKGH